jgi:serine/threonine-protein kinase
VLEALGAVAHAHARGIVHRDLKPSNLLRAHREDGSPVVKVLDFGISKSLNAAQQSMTATRGILGSPAYMAPEHIRSPRTVDGRADIWSLGVVLYELSCGSAPYDGAELGELLAAILEREPLPLASRRANLPADFCALVHRCLAKNPGARFQNAAELADALVPFAGDGANFLADRVRKALNTRAESRPGPSAADASGSLPAVAAVTGPPQVAPIVATTGTALTHSTAQPARRRRPVVWIAGAAALLSLLCGVALAVIATLSVRHRVPPQRAPASAVTSASPVSPAAPAASAQPTTAPPPNDAPSQVASIAPVESSAPTASAPLATSARPPWAPPRRFGPRPSSGGKASGLSTSRN